MADFRYPQFCALARAAEVVGERWTLLILRELLLGAKRFTDLRERLDGISASVLTARLARLETDGLVSRRVLDRPAPAVVYELTETGGGLEPAVLALAHWGARFLVHARPRERLEADWLRLALAACARREPTPLRSFLIRMRDRRAEVILRVAGGPGGTTISNQLEPADVTLSAEPSTILALMSGVLSPRIAVRDRRVEVSGDSEALEVFPALFDAAVTRGEANR
ncbi:MAG TPA: winged helix-turn-helix transcriptional regulator [Methylomirabilota bacterium]|nr:winged helix-turn-helix transcriptional regulator [Methylomirabilota bacterium]